MLLESRQAVRGLRRSPGFTASAILILALAIGASTAMFGVLDTVLLRPLPFPSPDRLAMIWTEIPSRDVREGRSAFHEVEAWREQSRSVADFAVFDPVSVTLTADRELEQVSSARVSPNLFRLLGVSPERGRLFTDRDAGERQRLALISHRFWQTRFAGSAAILGATVQIDGQPSQIIGVLPDIIAQAGFTADLWEPHTLFADWETRRAATTGRGSWFVLGRLRDAAAIEAAQRELEGITGALDATTAGPQVRRSVRIVPLREQVTDRRSRAAIWLLTGAALLVWLVAAIDVAGLTLARGASRLPQLAIQAALGASRTRLARALLAESAIVAGAAGLVGVAVALAATRAIRVVGPAYVARLADVHLDRRVLASAVVVSGASALLVGLAPIVAVWRRDLRVSGVDGGRLSSAGAGTRLRRVFVVGQCAAAIVLLAGAGLLVRSWWNVSRVDPGFRPEGVVALNLAAPAELPEAQRAAFYDAVLDRVARVPGVERAGVSSELLVGNVAEQHVIAEGSAQAGGQRLPLRRDEVAGDLFETLGTPLLRGRAFTTGDGHGSPRVAIVNAALAGRLWPGRDPVGRRFAFDRAGSDAAWFTVVGVVGDMRRQGLEKAPVAQMFEPVAQAPSRRAILLVRTSAADPLSRVGALRDAVRSVAPGALVYRVALVGDRLGIDLAERRVQTSLLLGCALMALLLSTLGLYALIQYSVVTRTHEIGVRMALGARAADIGRMVVGEGLVLAMAGLAIGLGASWWLGRTASALLFGVEAADPPTLVAVSALATVVAVAASYVPARRASRISPIVALRRRLH